MSLWDKTEEIEKIKSKANSTKDNPFRLYSLIGELSEVGKSYLMLGAIYSGKINLQVNSDSLPGVQSDVKIEDGYKGGKDKSLELMNTMSEDIGGCLAFVNELFVSSIETCLADLDDKSYHAQIDEGLQKVVDHSNQNLKFNLFYELSEKIECMPVLLEYYQKIVKAKGKEPKEGLERLVVDMQNNCILLHDKIFLKESDVSYS